MLGAIHSHGALPRGIPIGPQRPIRCRLPCRWQWALASLGPVRPQRPLPAQRAVLGLRPVVAIGPFCRLRPVVAIGRFCRLRPVAAIRTVVPKSPLLSHEAIVPNRSVIAAGRVGLGQPVSAQRRHPSRSIVADRFVYRWPIRQSW